MITNIKVSHIITFTIFQVLLSEQCHWRSVAEPTSLGHPLCREPYIRNADTTDKLLRSYLETELFGQHVAQSIIPNELFNHLSQVTPRRPLTLSFHGWTGSGKTFAARLIMRALYENGGKSPFVKFYTASYHFPDPDQVAVYKKKLSRRIQDSIKNCSRTMFVFDEVDKFPAGLLDVLVPILKNRGQEYKRAIFIFLGNAGADDISNVMLDKNDQVRVRDDLKIYDFEHILSAESLQRNGGWYKSKLIEEILVTRFVPFLPMERQHVMQCFQKAAKLKPGVMLEEADFEEIANRLVYWPRNTQLYSMTGCKRVENLLGEVVEEKEEYEREKRRRRSAKKKEL